MRSHAAAALLGSHLCRGNRLSWGGRPGSYDAVAEQLFNELHVDRFLLEYDSDRWFRSRCAFFQKTKQSSSGW